ncbi:MAG: dephospho-CoA kinase [Nitrospiraceae bacterium]|nr:dephospho-CoA kinase [Nitrospiraceae bacterium]
MLLVGLTGGIASGKSLVTRVFRDLGAHIVDADKIVHELLAVGQGAYREVAARFGATVLAPDGSLDRRKIGDIVFNDPDQRAWLNACIHPRVFEAYQHQVRHIRDRDPNAVVVLDAALLIETGYHTKMDRVVVVSADEEQQLDRLMARDRFTRDQALARIRSQMPLSGKRAVANFVIDNRGTREATEHQAREVFERLRIEAMQRT